MKHYYDDEDDDDQPNPSRYITKEEARPDNRYHSQEYACPNCGSYNTGQSTYSDYCNSCGWGHSY